MPAFAPLLILLVTMSASVATSAALEHVLEGGQIWAASLGAGLFAGLMLTMAIAEKIMPGRSIAIIPLTVLGMVTILVVDKAPIGMTKELVSLTMIIAIGAFLMGQLLGILINRREQTSQDAGHPF